MTTYYALTTLTTVGFGDYYPTTNFERLFMCVVFVGGISVYSVFQGALHENWLNYERVTGDIYHGEDLNRFFSLLKKYNHNKPLNRQFIREMEDYFEYYWTNDRRVIAETAEDLSKLEQLPENVKNQFLLKYLFGGFQAKFKSIIQKDPIYNSDLDKPGFFDFNTALILNLEPRFIPGDTIIFEEG